MTDKLSPAMTAALQFYADSDVRDDVRVPAPRASTNAALVRRELIAWSDGAGYFITDAGLAAIGLPPAGYVEVTPETEVGTVVRYRTHPGCVGVVIRRGAAPLASPRLSERMEVKGGPIEVQMLAACERCHRFPEWRNQTAHEIPGYLLMAAVDQRAENLYELLKLKQCAVCPDSPNASALSPDEMAYAPMCHGHHARRDQLIADETAAIERLMAKRAGPTLPPYFGQHPNPALSGPVPVEPTPAGLDDVEEAEREEMVYDVMAGVPGSQHYPEDVRAEAERRSAPAGKSNHQCRTCGYWLEGEWNTTDDAERRAQLQRQMDAGQCDSCSGISARGTEAQSTHGAVRSINLALRADAWYAQPEATRLEREAQAAESLAKILDVPAGAAAVFATVVRLGGWQEVSGTELANRGRHKTGAIARAVDLGLIERSGLGGMYGYRYRAAQSTIDCIVQWAASGGGRG